MADRSGESSDQALMDRLFTRCPEILRTRWCPTLRRGVIYNSQNGKLKSKFGGNKPFRPDNFKWPVCDSCGSKKSFICQLNIETLPLEFQDKIKMYSGLFQLFCCVECIPRYIKEETRRSDSGMYSHVCFVQKSEFVPSLMSLAAEVFAQQKSSNMNVLPGKLREYVENFTESAPPTRSKKEKVVRNWRKELEVVDEYAFKDDPASNISSLTDEINSKLFDPWSPLRKYLTTITHNDTDVINDHCQTKIGGWMGYYYCSRFTQAPQCPDCGDKVDINFLHENGNWSGLHHIEINVYLCSKCSKFEVQV